MNAPPPPRERRRRQERDFSGRRDGVRDKVNEFRARRDRRDEKSRNDRRGGALGARAVVGPRGSNARSGAARGRKAGGWRVVFGKREDVYRFGQRLRNTLG